VNLRVLPEAAEEGLEAASYYENARPGLGLAFLDALEHSWETISDQPSSFSRLETLRTKRDVRFFQLRRFPYLVIYEIRMAEILVLAVAHGSRRPNYWKNRLG
jgi:plasmid stabilization system protein ParE